MATYPSSGVLKNNVGKRNPVVLEQDYDLSTLLSAVLATADVVNLFSVPAGTLVVGGSLECLTAGTGASVLTLQLAVGSTNLSTALDCLAAGAATTAGATTAGAAQTVKLTAAVTGTVTKNPTVRVKLVIVEP